MYGVSPAVISRARATWCSLIVSPVTFAPVARTRVGGGRAGARALLRSTAADVAPVDGGTDYSSTVLLPDTPFPQRADSSNRERAIQEYWRENEARVPSPR